MAKIKVLTYKIFAFFSQSIAHFPNTKALALPNQISIRSSETCKYLQIQLHFMP